MKDISKILQIAATEIGVVEHPPGSNKVKYNVFMYQKDVFDGDKPGAKYPWCGCFVSWVFYMAGLPLGRIDYLRGFAGCPYAVANVPKWGKIVTDPQPNDVAFFDWNSDKRYDHTGIVEKVLENGKILTIEGNTAVGNDSNGGAVMRRERDRKFAIFVRPNVLTAA